MGVENNMELYIAYRIGNLLLLLTNCVHKKCHWWSLPFKIYDVELNTIG